MCVTRQKPDKPERQELVNRLLHILRARQIARRTRAEIVPPAPSIHPPRADSVHVHPLYPFLRRSGSSHTEVPRNPQPPPQQQVEQPAQRQPGWCVLFRSHQHAQVLVIALPNETHSVNLSDLPDLQQLLLQQVHQEAEHEIRTNESDETQNHEATMPQSGRRHIRLSQESRQEFLRIQQELERAIESRQTTLNRPHVSVEPIKCKLLEQICRHQHQPPQLQEEPAHQIRRTESIRIDPAILNLIKQSFSWPMEIPGRRRQQ